MEIKVIIVCFNKYELEDIVSVRVRTDLPRASNKHLIAAKDWAKEMGWRGPMICFDENSPSFSLFDQNEMDWGSDDEVIDS